MKTGNNSAPLLAKFGKYFMGASLLFSTIIQAQELDLKGLYESAVEYNASIAAAEAEYLAQKEGERASLGALLPTVALSAGIEESFAKSKPGELNRDDLDSNTRSYGITLTQPIFNYSNLETYKASKVETLIAEATYLDAKQQLILDVSTAYFSILRSRENLSAANALETALKRQYEQAKEQFDVGLIAITDVHEAKASFDSSRTDRIRVDGELDLAYEQLSLFTPTYHQSIKSLKANFPVAVDKKYATDDWISAATKQNLQVQISELAVKASKNQLESNKGALYPTLNFQAAHEGSITSSASPSGPVVRGNETSFALSLNVPLYSGGALRSNISRARLQEQQRKDELESARRGADIQVRTEFLSLRVNKEAIESLQQNIVSRKSALDATREGYKVGTRNIVEVLDAERNYFTALRDYANARFDFIESSLRLKRAAGTLSEADIVELNQWLESPKS